MAQPASYSLVVEDLPLLAQLQPDLLNEDMVGSKEKVPFLPWITYKTLLGNLAQVPFALFEALISFVAMFFSDWSTLQWTVSAATFLQVRDAKRNLLVL